MGRSVRQVYSMLYRTSDAEHDAIIRDEWAQHMKSSFDLRYQRRDFSRSDLHSLNSYSI
jgi:hypothetical protein